MRRRSLALGLASLAAAGCATPATAPPAPAAATTAPVEWAYEVRAALAPARLREDADDLEILNTVASVIAHDLHLPLPDRVVALAYADDAAFARALRRRGAPLEDIPEMVARTAALAAGGAILLRADRLARQPLRVRAGLYAHELTHVAQGRFGPPLFDPVPLWLLEGHAEWAARRVIHILELGRYAPLRDEVQRQVGRSATPRERFPALQELQTRAQWWEAVKRFGWTPTYGQAFLAVDWLVAGHGEERVRGFLGKPGKGKPGTTDLPDVSVYTLLGGFRAYLHGLP